LRLEASNSLACAASRSARRRWTRWIAMAAKLTDFVSACVRV
jgi:hypothetical protein